MLRVRPGDPMVPRGVSLVGLRVTAHHDGSLQASWEAPSEAADFSRLMHSDLIMPSAVAIEAHWAPCELGGGVQLPELRLCAEAAWVQQ